MSENTFTMPHWFDYENGCRQATHNYSHKRPGTIWVMGFNHYNEHRQLFDTDNVYVLTTAYEEYEFSLEQNKLKGLRMMMGLSDG